MAFVAEKPSYNCSVSQLVGLWTKSQSERGSVSRSIVIHKERVELVRKPEFRRRCRGSQTRGPTRHRLCPWPFRGTAPNESPGGTSENSPALECGTCLVPRRSAELYSAVSQSCTLQAVARGRRVG